MKMDGESLYSRSQTCHQNKLNVHNHLLTWGVELCGTSNLAGKGLDREMAL